MFFFIVLKYKKLDFIEFFAIAQNYKVNNLDI